MTTHPRNRASAAAEALDVSEHSSDAEISALLDDWERGALAMITKGSAQLASCRALRALLSAPARSDACAGEKPIPLKVAAELVGVTKRALRAKAKRHEASFLQGDRLFILPSALAALYPKQFSRI